MRGIVGGRACGGSHWHYVAEAEVKKIDAALSRHTGQEKGEGLHHLWGGLGILLQQGDAAIFGNQEPNHLYTCEWGSADV